MHVRWVLNIKNSSLPGDYWFANDAYNKYLIIKCPECGIQIGGLSRKVLSPYPLTISCPFSCPAKHVFVIMNGEAIRIPDDIAVRTGFHVRTCNSGNLY